MSRRHLSRGRQFDEHNEELVDKFVRESRKNLPAQPFEIGVLVRCNTSKQPWRVTAIYFSEGPGRWFVVGRLGACKWYQWADNCERV